jgi:hypothetical protein
MSQFDLGLAVQQYTQNVQLLSQQRGSRLRASVMSGNYEGRQAAVVDQYAATTARKVTSRYAPLVPVDMQNDRRWVSPTDYDWDELVDNFDKLRLLNDPTSHYVMSAVESLNRAIDQEIITAYFGTAKTGETGTTSTTFLAANQVAATFGSGGGATGLTVAKLIEAKRLLKKNEAIQPYEQLFCVITAQQEADLLNEIQVINTDYSGKAVLVDGEIQSFLGINFIHSEILPNDTTPYRRIPVYTKSAMHLGMWNDITTDVSQRKDLSSLPYQVYAMGSFGATRTEEKKIVEIKCQE